MSKIFLLLLLLAPTFSYANDLSNVEVSCWHESPDDDGSYYCQYVMVMGKNRDGEMIIPALAAPDQGGPKTYEQADRACKAMGFFYALRIEVEKPEEETVQVYLNSDGKSGSLSKSRKMFIQHVNCN